MPHPIQITETSPLLHDANCVYCHVDLDLGDQVMVCDVCQSPHHTDCWQANANRCATFGCEGSGAIVSESKSEVEQAFKEQVRLEMEQTYSGGTTSGPTYKEQFRFIIFLLAATLFSVSVAILSETRGAPNLWMMIVVMFVPFFIVIWFAPPTLAHLSLSTFKKEYPFLLYTFISVMIAALVTIIIDSFILKYEPNSFIPVLLFLPLSFLAYRGIRFAKGSIANSD